MKRTNQIFEYMFIVDTCITTTLRFGQLALSFLLCIMKPLLQSFVLIQLVVLPLTLLVRRDELPEDPKEVFRGKRLSCAGANTRPLTKEFDRIKVDSFDLLENVPLTPNVGLSFTEEGQHKLGVWILQVFLFLVQKVFELFTPGCQVRP